MNKSEFLKNLELMLVELPPDNRKTLLTYYEEMIMAQVRQGQAEEEIVATLDSPKSLAHFHLAEYLLDTAENDLTTSNLFRVMQATLRLGFSNLILLIGPVLGIAGAIFALLATSTIVMITGLALLLGVFIKPFSIFSTTVPLFFYENTIIAAGTFFLSIGLIAFGVLFLIGAYILVRLIYRGTLKHLRFHLITQQRG